jgi:hypothetical protein
MKNLFNRLKQLKLIPMVLLLMTFASGCASGPRLREVQSTLPVLGKNDARIYFYRTSYFGAGIQPDVKLNGAVVGEATPGKVWFVDVSPGNYVVQTTTETDKQLTFTTRAQQTRYIRFNMSMGFFVGHVTPELIDPAVGQNEIAECRYLAPKTSDKTQRGVAGSNSPSK